MNRFWMTLRHYFGRSTWQAWSVTRARSAVSWTIGIALVLFGLLAPDALPWWGWYVLGIAWFLVLLIGGRMLADRDLQRNVPHE